MLQYPNVLDEAGRAVVLTAIQRHGARRGWNLLRPLPCGRGSVTNVR